MSEFTISVYNLQKNGFDFGLDKYPIFDEAYREVLNSVIIGYYKWHEIGFQNPAQWKDRLNLRMELIMRNKYNALYKAKMLEFNPRYNVEMTETFEHEIINSADKNINSNGSATVGDTMVSNGGSTNTNVASGTSLGTMSRFPNDELIAGDLVNNIYVDSANNGKNSSTDTTTTTENNTTTDNVISTNGNVTNDKSTGNTKETYKKFTEGSSAGLPFSRAMLQLKDYLDEYQLDQLVIGELKDLFMSCWE